MTKLIVIGLDGATWEIINPLIESGKLPTIKNLLEISCHGKLESIVPPISVPAWKCYSTGKTPAKLLPQLKIIAALSCYIIYI